MQAPLMVVEWLKIFRQSDTKKEMKKTNSGGMKNDGVVHGSPMFAKQSSPIINLWKLMSRPWTHNMS